MSEVLVAEIPQLTVAGPGAAERRALRVLQFGVIAVVLFAFTYKPFELDRFFVPKELVLHVTALASLWFARRAVRRLALNWVDVLLIGFLLVSLFSAVLATNIWLAIRALAISASSVAIFFTARALRDVGLARPLLNALSLAVALGCITSLLQTYGVRMDFFSINRAPGGTLGNRNFVAHMAAFGLPLMLLTSLRAQRTWVFLGGAIGGTIVSATLVITRSRAGYLAALAAVFVFMAAKLLSPQLRLQRRTWGRLGAILVMAIAGVIAGMFVPNTLRWRSDNPYLESFSGVANFQEGSGAGRLVQYRRSLVMTRENPIFGVAPGNWSVEYPRYAARRDPSLDRSEPGTTSNPWPSSDWVAFLAERGVLATLMLAAVFAIIALQTFGHMRRATDVDEATAAAALLAMLIAANVAGLFDAVLLLALPAMIVWTALGALWSDAPAARFANVSARARNAVTVALLVVLAAGALRSTAQLVGMGIFTNADGNAAMRWAARIDPGNYRVRLRLARAGRRAERCDHARAANKLFPRAGEARNLSRGCD